MMEFHNRNVADPLKPLSEQLEDYFVFDRAKNESPHEWVEQWFSLPEQGKKDWIRVRDKGRCLICGKDTNEVHEIKPKGSQGGAPALVPWNMISVCREHHDLLQRHIWSVYKFDPLDREDGLIVLDELGHSIEKDKLFFYRYQSLEEFQKAERLLQEWARARIANEWQAAHALMEVKKSGLYEESGLTFYEYAATLGIPSAKVKRMLRAAKFAESREEQLTDIPLNRIARLARKKLSDPDIEEWIIKAQTLGPMDFEKEWKERFGTKRPQTFTVVEDPKSIKEVEAEDQDSINGQVVIKGKIVRGLTLPINRV